jgi:hypothetical protein
MALLDEGATTCCYARSDKHWVTDPQGVAWEHFHTLGEIPVFREETAPELATASACCAPSRPVAEATCCAGPVATKASTSVQGGSSCC